VGARELARRIHLSNTSASYVAHQYANRAVASRQFTRYVTLVGGKATAKAIPDAELVLVDGMGHDLPEPVWEPIVDALTENFSRAHA
jgi:pimeloyl-ACP methyl ester carboxylesterase